MTDAVSSNQVSYTIYGGDIQIRTPQDQGPFLNAAVDVGAVPVAVRSLYTDASAPSYFCDVVTDAYQNLIEGQIDSNDHFVGVVGMGDYLDMGCEQEFATMKWVVDELARRNPVLKFALMTRGNHDGGYYMGTIWSAKNFLGFLGLLYPDLVNDALSDLCGDAEHVLEANESVQAFDQMVRGDNNKNIDALTPEAASALFREVLVNLKRGNWRGFVKSDGTKKIMTDAGAFAQIWHASQDESRWDAIVHVAPEAYEPNHTDASEPNHVFEGGHSHHKRRTEFSRHPQDTKSWVHLQAKQVADFAMPSTGQTVPVYEIAMDTQDLTSYSPSHATVKGHVSALQIAAVNRFIDEMLKKNPNAKFKLVMHFPPDKLVPSAKRHLKKLLEREEIIFLKTAHSHERGFRDDVSQWLHLKRRNALPHLSIPSTTDLTREVVVEKMEFIDVESGHYRIRFDLQHYQASENDLLSGNPFEVRECLDDLTHMLLQRKLGIYERLTVNNIPVADYLDENGNPRTLFLNEDEVMAQFHDPFLKVVTGGKVSRQLKVWTAVKMFLSLGGNLANHLIAEASIPQMAADFETFSIFLSYIPQLLETDGYHELARIFERRLDFLHQAKLQWLQEYSRKTEHDSLSAADKKQFNNLYSQADLNSIYVALQNLPEGSSARSFVNIVGLRASLEEASYHHYNTAAMSGVPDHIQTEYAGVAAA